MIGVVAIADITVQDVLKILTQIWSTKPETASRQRSRIELILENAIAASAPRTQPGHLAQQPQVTPAAHLEGAHGHASPGPRLAGSAGLHADPARACGVAARALEFTILTGARSGEVRATVWVEIDRDAAVWKIRAQRIKGAREHRVPLSRRAMEILDEMAELNDGSGLIFSGLKDLVPMSDVTMLAVLRRVGHDELTVHGFRSTFRDWAAEATGHPNHVVEQALAHAIPSAVEAALPARRSVREAPRLNGRLGSASRQAAGQGGAAKVRPAAQGGG